MSDTPETPETLGKYIAGALVLVLILLGISALIAGNIVLWRMV